jgi:hypothetical protein
MMKAIQPQKLPLLVFSLCSGLAVACGPDKDKGAGEQIEEAAEEVGDEVDDATDDE